MMKEAISVIKARRATSAAVLSLTIPGLGHIYAGDLRKGLSLIGIMYGVILLAGIFGVLSTFYGIVSLTLLAVGFYIYVASSSVKLALKNREYQLQTYNRWYWYLAIYVSVSFFADVLISHRGDIFGYEMYRISARSMEPTLQSGDYITVNTRYQQPEVGDVVVFLYPKDRSLTYINRVAAIGNDSVSINHGIVSRNGKPESLLLVPEDKRLTDESISMEERQIPEGQIFLLGDWRDQSNDSRYRGTVPVADVIGKVTYIWLSNDVSRIGEAVE
jgi:signal peptidase I